MKRRLKDIVIKDLFRKIILITGPRQCGKTTLSKSLHSSFDYFNYDAVQDQNRLRKRQWDRQTGVLIFDELHKMPNWKQWLKGIYDTEGIPPGIVVTGSAKLDTYKNMGDSLAGRFFQFRLHPFDVSEAIKYSDITAQEAFTRLMRVSGFPEPFLENKESFYRRWQQSHLDIILRQDLLDLESVQNIRGIELLIELLRSRVGSTVSYANLAREVGVSETTIKRWITILENMYIVFRVTPYSRNIARSLLKAPKLYFYDTAFVDGDDGTKAENIVACALHKKLDFLNDVEGIRGKLYFLRTKDGKEIDFVIEQERKATHLIEVKWADENVSPAFSFFKSSFDEAVQKYQWVHNLSRPYDTQDGVRVDSLAMSLARFELG